MKRPDRENVSFRVILVFTVGLILASILHITDRLLNVVMLNINEPEKSAYLGFGSTVLFVLNLGIYVFLVFYWIISLRTRLLPSKGRQYFITAAAGLIFLFLIRAVKYRVADNDTMFQHYLWYVLYIPLLLMPTLFLLTCVSMEAKVKDNKYIKRVIWVLFAVVLLLVLTNDWHKKMFCPYDGMFQNGSWGTYYIGPLWFVLYGYIFCCVLAGLILLVYIDRGIDRRKRVLPHVITSLLILGMMMLIRSTLLRFNLPVPWAFPEAVAIVTMCIFESCIRSRLIPYNENYIEFYKKLRFPTVITDRDFATVYQSASPINASAEQLKASLDSAYESGDDILLYGKPIKAGYIFWQSNEKVIRGLNEDLTDIAESLEAENDLIKYENEQKEERAHVDARNQLYVNAAREVFPTQKKIAALLEKTKAGSSDCAQNIARILFLNAYVKRKTNFLLMSSEQNDVSASELFLALDESARFLTLCGIKASVVSKTENTFLITQAIALYDGFELIAEALPENTDGLLITLFDQRIQMVAGCEPLTELPPVNADAETFYEDGQFFISLTAREEGSE